MGGFGGGIRGGALGGALSGEVEFDTGLAIPQRSALRQHIVLRLAPLLKSSNPPGYLRKVGRLPQPLHSAEDDELGWIVTAIGVQVPGVLVALGDQDFEYVGMSADESEGTLEVAIYVACGNTRDFVDGRLEQDDVSKADATADPGIEVILEHLRQLLSGQDTNLAGTHELRCTRERVIKTLAEYTIWEQRYTVKMQTDVKPWRGLGFVNEVRVDNVIDGPDAPQPVVSTLTTLKVPG